VKRKSITIRLIPELVEQIDELAVSQGRNRSNLIEQELIKTVALNGAGAFKDESICPECKTPLTKHPGYNGQSGWIAAPWENCENARCKMSQH